MVRGLTTITIPRPQLNRTPNTPPRNDDDYDKQVLRSPEGVDRGDSRCPHSTSRRRRRVGQG